LVSLAFTELGPMTVYIHILSVTRLGLDEWIYQVKPARWPCTNSGAVRLGFRELAFLKGEY
jgi:hypothetical protein